jgi:tetratricopeptide (TPR) repeat protein
LLLWFMAGAAPGGAVTPSEEADQVLTRARSAFESWQFGEALKLYRVLAKGYKGTTVGGAEASVRVGDCLFQLNRYSEAAEAYSEALRDYPSASAKYFPRLKVADCLVKMGRLEEARRLYEAALKSHGEALASLSVTTRIEWLTAK